MGGTTGVSGTSEKFTENETNFLSLMSKYMFLNMENTFEMSKLAFGSSLRGGAMGDTPGVSGTSEKFMENETNFLSLMSKYMCLNMENTFEMSKLSFGGSLRSGAMGDTPGVSGTFEIFTEITYLNLHLQEYIRLSS